MEMSVVYNRWIWIVASLLAFSARVEAKVDILLPQSFTAGEFAAQPGKSEWYAVVHEKEGYRLRKTRVTVHETRPPEFGLPSRLKAEFDFSGMPVFFLKGLTLQEGPLVAQEIADKGRIPAGTKVALISLGGVLAASGKTIANGKIENYRLTVETPSGADQIAMRSDSALPSPYRIYFVGDVNRDGLPDMLLDTARLPEGFGRDIHFYLSEKDGGKFKLKLVYRKYLTE